MTRFEINDNLTDPLTDDTWSGCEQLIKEFEAAWRRGDAPSIDDFVGPDGPARHALLLELVHTDIELRLKSGESARIESYWGRYPHLFEDRGALLDLITAEYELRRRREHDLDPREYGRRFPDCWDELASRLAGIDRVLHSGPWRCEPNAIHPPIVPGYDIVAEIGRGGMGVVYQAYEPQLGRHVALKFLPVELARDPILLDRFRREAQTASALNHPHICTIHALGEHEGRPYIVLEFIEGQTLKALQAQQYAVAGLMHLIRQAAGALAAAHAAAVVHRDIKPENIMVRPDGYVKVLDFGLARRLPTLSRPRDAGSQDTWPGTLLGTVAYMSPEQARGEPLAGSSDVFSLGVVLYQLVTGQHPFSVATSAFETLHAIANNTPLSPCRLNPQVSAALEGLIEAMLHKDPRLRPSAAEVENALANVRPVRIVSDKETRRVVHREPELNALRNAFSLAEAGHGTLVCVVGEPGIGKTTLVEDFLDELAAAGPSLIGRGRCSERQAGAAAYLPVIDAVADLLRGEQRSSVARVMQVVAPSWNPQLALAHTSDSSSPSRAFTQQAMLREFANLLAELSRLGSVVLFFDDVHWADVSTVDLLAYVGRHCQDVRALVIVTCRPTELFLGPHPFHRVKLELQGSGVCTELPLGFLGRGEIDHYLDLAFPGRSFSEEFIDLIYSRTEGSPLFLVDLLRYLRERGVIAQREGCWTVVRELPDLSHELPETVRSMIQRKLERLELEDRRLLATAAAQGHEFDSTIVADALARDVAEVEDRLQILDRVHGLVRPLRETEFPDRSLATRYVFVHILYQHALFGDLTPARRAALGKAIARALERHYGGESPAISAELAYLYETGREFAQGARYFHLAALNAARVFAHQGAVTLAKRGLSLLAAVPGSPERAALELNLQTTLGLQLQVTEGYAADEAERAYNRARELCPASSPAAFFPVLWGLWLVHKVRSELPRAQEVAGELSALAQRLQNPDLALQAHQALGLTALCRGLPLVAQHHVEQVAALYDLERHRTHAFLFGQDPGVICKAFGAVAQWLLGYPDTALLESNRAIEMSRDLSPNSQSVAQHFAAMVRHLCRFDVQARESAEASLAIAGEHGFSFWLAGGRVIRGWAASATEGTRDGIEQLRQGLVDWKATGSGTYVTYYLGLLADALGRQGAAVEGIQVLDEALALVSQTDERFYEAELWRLRGELRLLEGGRAVWSEAESDFQRALEIARQQPAQSLVLRALLSLARLDQQRAASGQGPSPEVRRLLEDAYATFTEGLQTPDLLEARSLLASS